MTIETRHVNSYKYVSRGGEKIEGILKTGIVEVKDKICFDIGSSTGGFVDCLLRYGAKKVYCCDVGKNLLDIKLRNDSRVVVFEGVNFRYFKELGYKDEVKQDIDIFTIDVSFISLEKILPVTVNINNKKSDWYMILLVKPQFECDRKVLKNGLVLKEQDRLSVVDKISLCALKLGLKEIYRAKSQLCGMDGNIEYFLILKK